MSNELNNVINLENHRVSRNGVISKIFTGRDRGLDVQKDSKINEISEKYDEVTIIIPDNIYSINPSFFEELFEVVVDELGREGFNKKFKFVSEGRYNYKVPLEEALSRLLRKKTALDK